MAELLRAEGLVKRFARRGAFGARGPAVTAVDGVSFSLSGGEALVLAGESGSGKTTIAKMLLGALRPDAGRVLFRGADASGGGEGAVRAGCQMVQQDPYDSVNPRMRVGDIVAEPLEARGYGGRDARRRRALEALAEVKLEPAAEVAGMRPHALSGGQRQRVVLARALAPRPEVIVADEPVSMLDVSVRAELLGLMSGLRRRLGIAFVYITHDLATARHFGGRIAVLYRGRVVESGPVADVLLRPMHPYTRALVDAVPEPDPANLLRDRRVRVAAGGPSGGCAFRARCPCAVDRCASVPPEEDAGGGRTLACFAPQG